MKKTKTKTKSKAKINAKSKAKTKPKAAVKTKSKAKPKSKATAKTNVSGKSAVKAVSSGKSLIKNLSQFLSPLDDRILVVVEGSSEVTAGGIIIPGTVAEKPNRGHVVAKGPGRRMKKGGLRPLDVQLGDRVLFPEYSGTKVTIENQECLILREEDLLGIVT